MRAAVLAIALGLVASPAAAQAVSQAGFVEGQGYWFPEVTFNDSAHYVGDALLRQEVVLRPAKWIQFVAGAELRANSHGQVEDEWRLDWDDRGLLRPRAAVRQLVAKITAGRFRLDVGKQFVRWGRADIVYPTDRFAPRDYLNVVTTELLPVIGARASLQAGSETLEAVWVPRFTPSRLPLFDQRWSPVPPGVPVTDLGSNIPGGSQFGARWRHTGSRIETAFSYFDGFNHQPDLEVRARPDLTGTEILRVFPRIRQYGGDVALPMSWLTIKAEAAFVTSPPKTSDEYLLYVVEIERQAGNWLLDGGYVGQNVTEQRVAFTFAPDRSLAKSILGRAFYSADPRRTFLIEAAVQQNGDGYYGKAEFSEGMGQHWRLTVAAVGLGGEAQNFLGQYRHNSHATVTLRFSY